MKISSLQATKRLPKRQISDNVKGDKIEPFHDIEDLAFLCEGVDVVHQLGHKSVDNGLLIPESFLGETIRQSLSLTGVGVMIGHRDGRHPCHWIYRAHMDWVFVEIFPSVSMSINVLPGGCTVERKLIRAEADYWAVLVVELSRFEGQSPTQCPYHTRKLEK